MPRRCGGGIGGFGIVPSHNQACRRLGEIATDPTREMIEYIKRDIANIALGNKDNHARNTAIQRRHEVVYMPPTHEPSAKQTTASVRRSWARKLSRSTCSNRTAIGNS